MTKQIPGIVMFALGFAHRAHDTQEYANNHPYVDHLEDVVRILQEFGVTDEIVLVAGALHDVVEDTPTSLVHIEWTWNERVAELVELVTNKPGANRAEKHAATYPALARDADAVQIKLADRIGHLRAGGKNAMYKKEQEKFRGYLYNPNHPDNIQAMWLEIDALFALDNAAVTV